MQESSLILSEYEEINSLLYKPIVATQRIKYTCINVSSNHIVLGSTSGSLYLFTRESCTFQQVIPLSEGPVTQVCISPDEKTVALSTKRGSVRVLSLKPSVKLLSISNEHLHETVTCLCWNSKSSELYVGDRNGKISTIVLSIFTVNGMFQAPSCALMHLDSAIVQVDYSSHYLLVSTLTRSYICDTSQEQFKQIGNKVRDGDFGACFMKKPPVELEIQPEKMINSNKASAALNSIIGLSDDDDLLIYCARPGFRLWEVSPNGIVTKTHQFKDALSVSPTEIFRSSNLQKNDNYEQTTQILNFSRLHVINKRYLLSHTNNSLYIINPVSASIVLWTDKLSTITMAQTFDDKIYLMDNNCAFHCLTLSSIDYLILRLFEMKFYSDCMRTCTTYRSDLMRLVENNENSLQLNCPDEDLVRLLEPIVAVIQSNNNTQPKRLNSGIVVVNSGGFAPDYYNGKYERDVDSSSDSEIVCNPVKIRKKSRNTTKIPENHKKIDDFTNNFSKITLDDNVGDEISVRNGEEGENEEKFEDPRRKILESATVNIQSDLQPVYLLINNLKSSMSVEDLEETILNIVKSIQDINFKYEDVGELKIYLYEVVRSTERLYFHALLENINLELLRITENEYIVDEVTRAFVDLNSSAYTECLCGFPRFSDVSVPKFVEVGECLVARFASESKESCVKLAKSVPYILRDYTKILIDNGETLDDVVLLLCLQTRDNTILSAVLPLIDGRAWEVVKEGVERMEAGRCVECGRSVEGSEGIDWNEIVEEVMRREGMKVAMDFLVSAEKYLPRIKLKERIFQGFIFTKLLNKHGFKGQVDLDRCNDGGRGREYSSICSSEAREQLVEALEKDLERPVNPNVFGNGAHHWGIKYQAKSSICPCCTLSLQTPVLLGNNGISIFPCGHAYHVNCLIQKKLTRCYLHSSD